MADNNAQGVDGPFEHHFPSWPGGADHEPQNVPKDHTSTTEFGSSGGTKNILAGGGGHGGYVLGQDRPD